jgi:hypothetical protein
MFLKTGLRSATSTAQNVTTSMTDSSSQSRDVAAKIFSADETIFEDDNAVKNGAKASQPDQPVDADSVSLDLPRESTEDSTQRTLQGSGEQGPMFDLREIESRQGKGC